MTLLEAIQSSHEAFVATPDLSGDIRFEIVEIGSPVRKIQSSPALSLAPHLPVSGGGVGHFQEASR